jgi:hypothetical protein
MRQIAWRDDDIEECKINPSWLKSGGANTVLEAESSLNFVQPDLIYTDSLRTVAVETKCFPEVNERHIAEYLCLFVSATRARAKFCRSSSPEQSPVVLSRWSIAGLTQQAEVNSTVSSWQDSEQENSLATNPITKRVYEQLADIPHNYRSLVQHLLEKFANTVPVSKASNLPPLRLMLLDDFSYLLEWTFQDRRLGFSLESDPKESGWYYVFARGDSELYESGTMDQLDADRVILQAMTA